MTDRPLPMAAPLPGVLPRHLAAILLALLLAAGCRGDGVPGDADFRVDVAFAPTPPIVGDTRIVVAVRDAAGAPVEDAVVDVEGTMLHPGMAPEREEARHEGAGRYVVPAFPFVMGGDWVLTTRVRRDGRLLAADERTVRVVSDGSGAPPDPPGSR